MRIKNEIDPISKTTKITIKRKPKEVTNNYIKDQKNKGSKEEKKSSNHLRISTSGNSSFAPLRAQENYLNNNKQLVKKSDASNKNWFPPKADPLDKRSCENVNKQNESQQEEGDRVDPFANSYLDLMYNFCIRIDGMIDENISPEQMPSTSGEN